MTAPAKAAASELRVVCSRGHDERKPLGIVDVLLRPFLDELSATFYGIAGNTSAQQRGGNDPQGRHMGDKSGSPAVSVGGHAACRPGSGGQ